MCFKVFVNVVITIIFITSTCDLKPSTASANKLPCQLVSTQIRT